MGGGRSKLDPCHATMPPCFRPILHLRLEEMRMCGRPTAARGDTALSKKELLATHQADFEMDDGSLRFKENDDHGTNVKSSKGIESYFKKKATKEHGHHHTRGPKKSALQPEKVTRAAEMNGKGKGCGKAQEMPEKGRRIEGGRVAGNARKEDEDKSEEEGALRACPGSPSFRVYCSNDHDMSDDDDHEKDNKDHPHHHSDSHVADQTHSVGGSISSNKISAKQPSTSKQKKRKRFRKVVSLTPKGGKNSWNIQGC